MPKVFLFCAGIGEFHGNFLAATPFGVDIHDTAFALFFRKTIDDEDGLTELDTGFHVEQSAIETDLHGRGHVLKGLILGRAAIDFDRDGEGESWAAAAFDHENLRNKDLCEQKLG